MAKRLKGAGALFYSIVVAGVLVFGARELRATAVSDCPYDGWHYLGYCVDNADCSTMCRAINPESLGGRCQNNCCTCYI
jgi:hypothetical protein